MQGRAEAKTLVGHATPPADAELLSAYQAFLVSAARLADRGERAARASA
jgi:hypothetical protein